MQINVSQRDGRVHAKVQRTSEGLWTSVNVIGSDGLLVDTELRLFATDSDVNDWIHWEAARWGFSRTAIEFVE